MAEATVSRQEAEQIRREQQYSQELAFAQYKRSQSAAADQGMRDIKKPSKILYGVLLYFAVLADIVFALITPLELTGVIAVIVRIAKFCTSTFFFVMSWWMGRKIKKIHLSGEQVLNMAISMESRIAQYRTAIARGIKIARGTSTGRVLIRALGRSRVAAATKALRKATRSPVVRSAVTGLAELVWILDLLPWYTINIVLLYRDHKAAYDAARQAAATYQETSIAEIELFRAQENQVAV